MPIAAPGMEIPTPDVCSCHDASLLSLVPILAHHSLALGHMQSYHGCLDRILQTRASADGRLRVCSYQHASFPSALPSLHLAHNLARPTQRLHHLLALLPPPHRILTLLEQIIQLLLPIHLL